MLAEQDSAYVLCIAIIGGGPAGLGAAIALSALPDVRITLYEKARELREVGAGISIGYNCWKVLELLGAADEVRGHLQQNVLHRNGLSGGIQRVKPAPSSLPLKYRSKRVRRSRLQAALVSKVPPGIIQLNKKLVSIHDAGTQGVHLTFEDGTETNADLLIGGDGIRSVVRTSLFPEHTTKFTGTTIWRTLIPAKTLYHIHDLFPDTSWWHGPSGHCYFSLVDDPSEFPDSSTSSSEQLMEISCRHLIDAALDTERRFSWGVPVTNERVNIHFTQYDPRVRDALSCVPDGGWKEFSAFSGPRLERLVGWEKVALLGDASHPLSGAFGSGAAFALEDGWILARAIELTTSTAQLTPSENDRDRQIIKARNIADALEIFDRIRSPYYRRMYELLDSRKRDVLQAQIKAKGESSEPLHIFESVLPSRLEAFPLGDELSWIYKNDIEKIWQNYLQQER
ncbi:hypothetical protein EYB25_009345 [Talaromyces marneffei]|uniref:uncharacterized protein n=1 Tax=Talaromyces marneffei TaxID=37727 RepID=UPI0012A96477|nr:uncharacterized protein EYB26_010017 [Talaromyces marneffei]KAE8548962.1 hypothetical protein EYB25_009345 [Talaromyces marneffei]QGA22301.1 hypothetical protein EYB26_010017 [Talaromyces marneffei]